MDKKHDFTAGFADQTKEVEVPVLPIEGTIPEWLEGTLVRNGPARFRLEDKTLNHWFDGLAMLHRFDIKNGTVSYANKFLDTPAYRADQKGKMKYSEFATDPCRSLFKRITQMFSGPQFGANANVSIGRIGGKFVAETEIPMPVAFDPDTLKTLGIVKYEDSLKGVVTTAHPHYARAEKRAYNYLINYGPKSTYSLYGIDDGSKTRQRIGVATAMEPSYMHSFGLSENHAILMEFPLVVNPLSLLFSGKPFIANFRWMPDRGTRFSLIHRKTGKVMYAHTDEAWFGFHHVNAVEHDGLIDVDVIVYPTADVVQYFFLDSLTNSKNNNIYPKNELRRFTIDPATGEVTTRTLVDTPSELPRINYSKYSTKPYRYVYVNGVAEPGQSAFLDTIAKFDVKRGTTTKWQEANHYPGEPVFVERPGATSEDDGVLLSVVLDATKNMSYLLILNAHDLSVIAKSDVPQHVPFGFHGLFVKR